MSDRDRNNRILVIDDNPLNVKLTTVTLAAHGFEVSTAVDGQSALEAIRKDPPALAYTDVQLPDIDGLELARMIKSDPATAGVIVIALTAYAMPDDRARAFAAGCDGFVTKPIDTRTLGALTDSYLAGHAEVVRLAS
jgi:CheY-like chemotaxis protein